jgi:hypothetical protein
MAFPDGDLAQRLSTLPTGLQLGTADPPGNPLLPPD